MVVKLLLEYVGENDFSSPIFKDLNSGYYFGSLDILVPDEEKGLIDEKSITEYFKNNPEAKLKLHNSSKRLILDGDFFNSIKEACLKYKVGRIKIKRWIAEGRGQFL